tara:strand:- start:1113 stop:1598 length:486 start_codon:yes stop_codon:yes gene_type:complete
MQPTTRYNPQTGQYEIGHVNPSGNWVPTLPPSGGGQAVLPTGPTTVVPSPRPIQGVTPQPVVAQPEALPVQQSAPLSDDVVLQEFMYAPVQQSGQQVAVQQPVQQPGQQPVAVQQPGGLGYRTPPGVGRPLPDWVEAVAGSRDQGESNRVESKSTPTSEKK